MDGDVVLFIFVLWTRKSPGLVYFSKVFYFRMQHESQPPQIISIGWDFSQSSIVVPELDAQYTIGYLKPL